MNGVVAVPLAVADERGQLHHLHVVIKLAPAGAMLEVVLGRVEVGVEIPRLHPGEQPVPLPRVPRLAVKTFDDPGQELIRRTVHGVQRSREAGEG